MFDKKTYFLNLKDNYDNLKVISYSCCHHRAIFTVLMKLVTPQHTLTFRSHHKVFIDIVSRNTK